MMITTVPGLHGDRACLHLGAASAWASPPSPPAFLHRPAHRSDLPRDQSAHRAPVVRRSLLARVRATLAACFRTAPSA